MLVLDYDFKAFVEAFKLDTVEENQSSKQESKNPPLDISELYAEGIKPGARNATLLRYATKLAHAGMNENDRFEVLSNLVEVNNQRFKNAPPISLGEILKVNNQASKYYKKKAAELGLNEPTTGKKKAAIYSDYWELFPEFLGPIKRDIFTDELMYQEKESNLWQPCRNLIDYLRGRFQQYQESGKTNLKFNLARVKEHLETMRDNYKPEFCIEVPAWDGRDRIRELTNRVELHTAPGVTNEHFYQLLCDWHAKMWQKYKDPLIQNRLIVYKGSQGLGKDFFIKEQLAAAGQFCIPALIESADKDCRAQLHYGLALTISEYDRTAKIATATLKDIITADSTFIRLPYDARARFRLVRCSLQASCNIDDILTDYTGNRRYLIFDLKSIDKSKRFSDADRLQVLAQGQALAAQNFRASVEAEAAMSAYILSETPSDPEGDILDLFDTLAVKKAPEPGPFSQPTAEETQAGAFSGFLPNALAADIVHEICRITRHNDRFVRRKLRKRSGKVRGDRGYFYRFVGA